MFLTVLICIYQVVCITEVLHCHSTSSCAELIKLGRHLARVCIYVYHEKHFRAYMYLCPWKCIYMYNSLKVVPSTTFTHTLTLYIPV